MDVLLDILGFFGAWDVILYIADYMERQDPILSNDLKDAVKRPKASSQNAGHIDPLILAPNIIDPEGDDITPEALGIAVHDFLKKHKNNPSKKHFYSENNSLHHPLQS